jgi:glycerol-3-phosphate O-acyltransferase / dihydroxyacetone phosphate acyltransferase
MLYSILSFVVRLALKIFFRKISVTGAEHIPKRGPMIVVGNHPNTFMDPILVAYAVEHEVHFLANGSIFKGGLVKWFLSKLNMIPVYRKQDAAASDQKQLNDLTFKNCYEFLSRKGILLIFPEGTSINERKLRPIKSGTARIALGAEERYEALNLVILPIGVNYSNPTRFGEEAALHIGPPIPVNSFLSKYNENPSAGVQELTATIEESLKSLVVITKDKDEDDLVRKVENVYASSGLTDRNNRLDVTLSKNIVAAINYYQETDPVFLREMTESIDHYLDNLKSLRVNDFVIGKYEPTSVWKQIRYVLYFVFGFPFYCLGLFFNYVPYIIPSHVANWISRDEEYRAPIMMTTGIFTFPLYYAGVLSTVWHFTHSFMHLTLLLIAMPLTGFFVLQYWKRLRNMRTNLSYYQIFIRKKNLVEWLAEQRNEIIIKLETARDRFVAAQTE